MNCTMNKRIKIQLDRMEQRKAHNDKKKTLRKIVNITI